MEEIRTIKCLGEETKEHDLGDSNEIKSLIFWKGITNHTSKNNQGSNRQTSLH